MKRLNLIAGIAICALLPGCGDGIRRVPVQGKITAKGAPLDNASVQFLPTGSTKGEGGLGVSDSNGNFQVVGTRAGDKVVAPGEYKVRVSRLVARDGTVLPPDAKDADYPGCQESIPAPYNSVDGTTLTVKVPDAGGAVNIDLPVAIPRRK